MAERWPLSKYYAECEQYWLKLWSNAKGAKDYAFHNGATFCVKVGIPLVAEWDLEESASNYWQLTPIPEEVIQQLEGRKFTPGMTVEYLGQSCLIVGICFDMMSDPFTTIISHKNLAALSLAPASSFDFET